MMAITGGCQCGAVRYAFDGVPKVGICHCRMCQKAVGGPFAVFAEVGRGGLRWTHGTPAYFKSSSVARRGFCVTCGTPLTYESDLSSGLEVTAGSLDDPTAFPPGSAAGWEAKLAWVDAIAKLPTNPTDNKFAGLESFQHPDHDT